MQVLSTDHIPQYYSWAQVNSPAVILPMDINGFSVLFPFSVLQPTPPGPSLQSFQLILRDELKTFSFESICCHFFFKE